MAAGMPLQVYPATRLFLELRQGGAVDGVNDNALPAIGDTDDAFAGHRLTAIGAAEGLVGGQAHDRTAGVDLFRYRLGRKFRV